MFKISEEKIERLRNVFLENMKEMFVLQNKYDPNKDIIDWRYLSEFITNVMEMDFLFQQICDLGEEGAIIRGASTKEFDFLKNEIISISKNLRELLTTKEYSKAMYFISEFHLLQRKIINSVANMLSPKPLYEFSKDIKSKVYSKNVFIVHGHDELNILKLANKLKKLGFNPIILADRPDKGRTLIEKLEEETLDVGYAFIIFTPDDIGISFNELYEKASKRSYKDDSLKAAHRVLRGSKGDIQKFIEYCEKFIHDPEDVMTFLSILKNRARQNVILELGYFVGKIGRDRVCCLHKGDLELPSDVHGVVYKKFNESIEECYEDIINELKAADYEINL